MARNPIALSGVLTLAIGVAAAHAEVTISKKPTQNMTCSRGICSPTARKAVLNATNLANMLAAGDVTVESRATAQDIDLDAAVSWTSTHRLTLDSFHSIAFNKPVTVAGNGTVTITTNDGGTGGDYRFFGKGHVAFWGTKDAPLIINNRSYTIAAGITKLRALIHHNDGGFYAIARDIDMKGEQYGVSPVEEFAGLLEGLGNKISNLTITAGAQDAPVAFIGTLDSVSGIGTVRDMTLTGANVTASGAHACVGALVGVVSDFSYLLNSQAAGSLEASGSDSIIGGLVCDNQFGTIARSNANVSVSAGKGSVAGGLIGVNENCDICAGSVDQSYSVGAVTAGDTSLVGGLVGKNLGGTVVNSYALGAAAAGNNAAIGGLVGSNENDPEENAFPSINTSYSVGSVIGGSGATVGGLIGQDLANPGIADSYWDLDTSGVSDPSQGAGNIANDPGITGLSDGVLKSDLPNGFDALVWGQNSKKNNGYPYLLLEPPP